jgi:hypothetical protein
MTTEYQPPIDKVINTINEIAEVMKNGDKIVYEELPKELCWRWTNIRNGKDWTIRAKQLKVILWNKEDKGVNYRKLKHCGLQLAPKAPLQ